MKIFYHTLGQELKFEVSGFQIRQDVPTSPGLPPMFSTTKCDSMKRRAQITDLPIELLIYTVSLLDLESILQLLKALIPTV